MARRPRLSSQTRTVQPGHGRSGYVRVSTDVAPQLRDALVTLAAARGVPLTRVVTESFERTVEAWLGVPEGDAG